MVSLNEVSFFFLESIPETCVNILSVDHVSGTDGKYFNFNLSDIPNSLGPIPSPITAKVDQYRNGFYIQKNKDVRYQLKSFLLN